MYTFLVIEILYYAENQNSNLFGYLRYWYMLSTKKISSLTYRSYIMRERKHETGDKYNPTSLMMLKKGCNFPERKSFISNPENDRYTRKIKEFLC